MKTAKNIWVVLFTFVIRWGHIIHQVNIFDVDVVDTVDIKFIFIITMVIKRINHIHNIDDINDNRKIIWFYYVYMF